MAVASLNVEPGGVLALEGPVEERRAVLLVVQEVPDRLGDAVDQLRRVVGRIRRRAR